MKNYVAVASDHNKTSKIKKHTNGPVVVKQ